MSDSSTLEHLRKAKSLLRQARAGEQAAIGRIRVQLLRLASLTKEQIQTQIKLADVQHALAREQGYANWAAFRREDAPLERFLAAVRGGKLNEAKRQLEDFPDIAEESIRAACGIGDPGAVLHHLESDPALATAEQGGWSPLLYACASPFSEVSARHAAGTLQCASLLLERGVDATPSDPVSKWSTLHYIARSRNMPIGLLLAKHGARPAVSIGRNRPDLESMNQAFKSAFSSPEMRDRMAKRMAELKENRPILDTPLSLRKFFEQHSSKGAEDSAEGMRIFLEHGLNPNFANDTTGETLLHGAARNGTAAAAEVMLAHGADPNRRRADGRTPYLLAVRAGNTAVTAVLRAHGAHLKGLRASDEFIGACTRADAGTARSILASNPGILGALTSEDRETLIQAAGRGGVESVRLMAELGFDLGWIGESGATALHVAAWHGRADVVRSLLEFRAPVNIRDTTYGSSPLAWAADGSAYCRDADDDFCAIINALLDAGAEHEAAVSRRGVTPETIGSARVQTLLKQRGFCR